MRRDEALLAVAKLTTEDRSQTHGDPIEQFQTAQALKDILFSEPHDMNPVERECAQMICTKLSRAARGKAGHTDHWLDIIGYAAIAVESRHIEEQQKSEEEIEAADARRMAHRLVKTPAPHRPEIDEAFIKAK